jgi:hypothetical protein
MKNLFPKIFLTLFVLAGVVACQDNSDYQDIITDGSYQTAAQIRLTNVIIHDIFSPPVASRIYAYPSIAAYEVAVLADSQYKSLMGQLNGLKQRNLIPKVKYIFHWLLWWLIIKWPLP